MFLYLLCFLVKTVRLQVRYWQTYNSYSPAYIVPNP